ncbi:MAG: dTDP-4-dehydrorhamnose reductase [Bacteroidota bacterium]
MKKITVAVTGAQGQLGKAIHELAGAYPEFHFVFLSRSDMPIHHFEVVRSFLNGIKPDVLINAAAYTAVDRAEQERELAFQVNGEAVGVLAAWCAQFGSKFIHISTDYVFDGESELPYTESDATGPQSVYGASKLEGELQAQRFCPDSLIIRTSWVYAPYGKNFVRTMLSLLREKESIRVVNDQIGSPTYAIDLARSILDILRSGTWAPGIFHFSNAGRISWYDLAMAIWKHIHATCEIVPIPTRDYPTPAKRPHYSLLNSNKMQEVFGINSRPWEEALQECLGRIA